MLFVHRDLESLSYFSPPAVAYVHTAHPESTRGLRCDRHARVRTLRPEEESHVIAVAALFHHDRFRDRSPGVRSQPDPDRRQLAQAQSGGQRHAGAGRDPQPARHDQLREVASACARS